MLARASFQNFKALKAVDVDLTPFTVIVGKNGSGKTSVLQGILDVSQVPVRRADEPHPAQRLHLIFGGDHDPARLVTRPGVGPMKIALTDAEGSSLSVEAKLAPEDATFVITASGNDPTTIEPLRRPPPQKANEVAQFLASPAVQRFGSAAFLRLDAGVMMKPSATTSEAPQLDRDGEGLASVLSYMAGAEPEALDAVRNDLAAVVPQVRRIRTFPAQIPPAAGAVGGPVMGHRFALDMGEGRLVPADMLAGFRPESDAERRRLSERRDELGFDPPEEPHRLTAHPNDARTDAKRVLRILVCGEDESRPPPLEEISDRCERTLNDLVLLERRGVACGLAAFLAALRDTLVPHFIPGPAGPG